MGNGIEMVIPVDPYQIVSGLVRIGLIRREIAEALGITEDQLTNLIYRDEKLAGIFKHASQEPNFQVEQALFRRAIGYRYKEVKKKLGKPVEVTIKEFAPDTGAAIFWLKNRDPDRWRDHVDIGISFRDKMHLGHQATALGFAKNITPQKGDGD